MWLHRIGRSSWDSWSSFHRFGRSSWDSRSSFHRFVSIKHGTDVRQEQLPIAHDGEHTRPSKNLPCQEETLVAQPSFLLTDRANLLRHNVQNQQCPPKNNIAKQRHDQRHGPTINRRRPDVPRLKIVQTDPACNWKTSTMI